MLGLAVVLWSCSGLTSRPDVPLQRRGAPDRLRVRTDQGGRKMVLDVPLEHYVQAAALSEFAPAAGELPLVEKMFEVQAVISRTYAIAHLGRHRLEGYDLCATTHCQLYEPGRLRTSRWAGAAREASATTSGLVLWFDNAPADAVFHADCGGHTSAASAVWSGTSRPYLRAQRDDGAASDAHAAWQYSVRAGTLLRALNVDPRTRPGSRLEAIAVLERDEAGRALRVALRGERPAIVRGEDFRDVVSRAFGPRAIRSTWFHVQRNAGSFTFTGRGYGHGVGLCQAGALARLKAGEKTSAVLQHYFPGTTLVDLP
jgi:stage II sporulation protein D